VVSPVLAAAGTDDALPTQAVLPLHTDVEDCMEELEVE
jgi:hypothetical protein